VLRDIKQIQLSLPSVTEQRSIAALLNTMDAAIASTQAVIAKLKQIRAGLLYDLLTRGLDHNGELRDPDRHPEQFKDSPLGRIPKAWNPEPLDTVIAAAFDYRGRTPLKLGMEWGDGDIPALSANNVEMGRINFSKETYYGSPVLYRRWMTNGDVQRSDVLITMEAPLGNIAQITDDRHYILSQRVVLLRPKQHILTGDYLTLEMMGSRFQKELIRNSSGSTAVGIQRSKLEKIMLLVPENIDEQKHAAQVVRNENGNIEATERELSKLQSLKSGLMSDLLIGRVRVPEHMHVETRIAL
jgi:type I restriction enzyme S subunit